MRSIDFYRTVHKDFTESTTCGALTSVVATVILAALFVLEVKSFMNVPVVTEVVMDSAPDGSELQINFDMLMPDLVCQFASIDVSGTNINTNFINFSWLPLYSAVFFFISELTLLDLLDFGADFC